MSVNKLIQLSEWEYNKLVGKANANDKSIEELAEAMYKEKGAYEIKLSFDLKQDFEEKFKIRNYAYVADWDRFEISMEDKRKLVEFVKSRTLDYMERQFGDQISSVNFLLKEKKQLKLTEYKLIGFTIAGWLSASTLILIHLFK